MQVGCRTVRRTNRWLCLWFICLLAAGCRARTPADWNEGFLLVKVSAAPAEVLPGDTVTMTFDIANRALTTADFSKARGYYRAWVCLYSPARATLESRSGPCIAVTPFVVPPGRTYTGSQTIHVPEGTPPGTYVATFESYLDDANSFRISSVPAIVVVRSP